MKRYAVLLAPEFRLQATLRHAPNLHRKPVALLEMRGIKPRVREMTAAARIRSVESGMTPTQAEARCPDLQLLHSNPSHERSAQAALLQAAERLSPFLESTAPGVATVELPEGIFSSCDFLKRIVSPLRALGLETCVGVAPTPDLALLAARFATPVKIVDDAEEFLALLPIMVLQPDEELAAVLESWGIRTVGDFVALPAIQVGERLGTQAIELAERAAGGRARPLRLVKPLQFFSEEADLEHALEMLEPLLFLLRRFLEQIATRLADAYLVAGKLRLVLRFEQGEAYCRVFTIPQPTRDVTLLFRMLHTHLENFSSDSPIMGVELAAKPMRPMAEQFSLLERGLRDPHQFGETLARLEALLGPGRMGTPEREPSHHPEAFHVRPYTANVAAFEKEGSPLMGVPWLRFRPPIVAQVVLQETRPAHLQSMRTSGPIRDARGPWIIEGNWWENRRWTREEWDVATDDGIYRLVRREGKWFLDGIYA